MKIRRFLPISVAFLLPATAISLPEIKEIIAGEVDIQRAEKELILSTSDKAIIHYESFNIEGKERVQFIQPSTSSAVLNRVTGADPSSILGSISSNGRVFLVNPHGVYFGPTASVNVGSLVVSTLDIKDNDFLNDHFEFTLQQGAEKASIHNKGHLSASPEGSILMIAPYIKNEGVLTARAGRIACLSGERVSVDFAGDGLVSFAVEGELKESLIEHLGSIQAPFGEVSLRMKTADQVIQEVLNIDGIQEGVEIIVRNGGIRIASQSEIIASHIETDGPGVKVEGRLDASDHYQGGKGGTIHLLGDSVSLWGASIDASGDLGGGTVLVGGDYKGGGGVRTSQHVGMNDTSLIQANARQSGDGGKIILWSDKLLGFSGELRAEGGIEGGNGGFVETSTAGYSPRFSGSVKTLAPQGRHGKWLIDPTSVTIVIGGGGTLASVMPPNCTVGGAVSIDPATINAATSDVTICAQSAPGTITVTNGISMTTNDTGLTFEAAGAININSAIVTRSGAINFQSGTGVITLGADVSISSIGSGATGAPISFGSGTTPININGDGVATRGLTISSGAGPIFISGSIGNTVPLGAISLTASSGSATLRGATYSGASINFSSGNITIQNSVAVTASSGTIVVNGNIDPDAGGRSLSITNTASSIAINGNLGTRLGFSALTLNAATTLSLRSVGSSVAGSTGGMTLTAPTGVTLSGSIYHTSGAAQVYNGPITLSTIASHFRSVSQPLTFSSTILSGVPMTISGAPTTVTFTGDVSAASILFQSGGDIIATSTNGISCSTFTQQNQTGNNTYSKIVTTGGEIQIFGTGLTFNTLQTGTNGNITIRSPVTIGTSPAIIDTTNGGLVPTGADVLVIGAINGTAANPQNLTITTGTLGNFGTDSVIGGTNPIGNLNITSGGGVTLSGIGGASAGAGVVTVNSTPGNITLDGTSGVFNATSHSYTGDVVIGSGAASATITSAMNQNITIEGAIEGQTAGATSLTISAGAGSGTATFGGIIGGQTSLNNLTVTARGITLEGVGGSNTVGVAGTLSLTASNADINFNGSTYAAGTHSYSVPLANQFNMNAGTGTLFAATVGNINFSNGEIVLASDTDLLITTNNGNFTFSSLTGTSNESLFASLGTGVANLGSIGDVLTDDIFNVTVMAGSIAYNGPIYADAFSHTAVNNIANAVPFLLDANTAGSYQVFNALGGSIGTPGDPISVNVPSGLVLAGASVRADFIGTTQDGTIHCLPSNLPPILTFNGTTIFCSPPPISPSAPLVIPSVNLFVPGIYNPDYNLSDYFYFKPDVITYAYLTPWESSTYVMKKDLRKRGLSFFTDLYQRVFGGLEHKEASSSRI